VPDRRKNRGPHPQDKQLFSPEFVPTLRRAVRDLSWLLSQGYAPPSSLKIVGDRYQLAARQRQAVMRSACSDPDRKLRLKKKKSIAQLQRLRGREIWLDGYNVLTTLETAMAGGVVLRGRDGSIRDIAGVHGTFRKVLQTEPAARLIGHTLARLDLYPCRWILDKPVSNSGRLRAFLLDLAALNNWVWMVELSDNPDRVLMQSKSLIASSDSDILSHCKHWFNVNSYIQEHWLPNAFLLDFFTSF